MELDRDPTSDNMTSWWIPQLVSESWCLKRIVNPLESILVHPYKSMNDSYIDPIILGIVFIKDKLIFSVGFLF